LSDHGLHRILSSYWLAHFYLKSAKVLLYFGLDCGKMQITIDVSPAFLEHGSGEKITV
jgi:hypothetical protein